MRGLHAADRGLEFLELLASGVLRAMRLLHILERKVQQTAFAVERFHHRLQFLAGLLSGFRQKLAIEAYQRLLILGLVTAQGGQQRRMHR